MAKKKKHPMHMTDEEALFTATPYREDGKGSRMAPLPTFLVVLQSSEGRN